MEPAPEPRVILDRVTRSVRLEHLVLTDDEVYRILAEVPDEDLPDKIRRALKIGILALRDAEPVSKVDFVERSFEGMRRDMDRKLSEVFGDSGKLRMELQRHFGDRGSLLFRLLNPSDEDSLLGRFRKQMDALIDPNREGSAFGDLKQTLVKEFRDLHEKIGARRAAEEERERSALKGGDLEAFVYESLARMGQPFDDRVEAVGDEPGPLGKKGDVLITVNPHHAAGKEVRIVFEVKNRPISLRGKNSIYEEIDEARRNRSAGYAVVVVRAKDAPAEIGSFRVDPKGAILCAVEEDGDLLPLEIAYKMARAEAIRRSSKGGETLDMARVMRSLEGVRSKLEMIKGMKAGLTGAETHLQRVKGELDSLREGIQEALDEITEAWSRSSGSAA